MKTFDDLEFVKMGGMIKGVHAVVTFENGMGASVVQSTMSYGGEDGYFELAILDRLGNICYTSGIKGGEDVFGYLNEDDVTALMAEIAAL